MLRGARRRSTPSAVAGHLFFGRGSSSQRGRGTAEPTGDTVTAPPGHEALQTLVDEPEQTLPTYVFRPRRRVGGTTASPPA